MSWMQNVRDGTAFRYERPFGCIFRHRWRTHQHNLRADDNGGIVFVIAWRQCNRCGKSKLIHILK